MKLKVTGCNDLKNNVVELLVRDCDDNPIVLEGQYADITVSDLYGKTTKFVKCSLMGRNSDFVEPTHRMLVHPYIYRYEAREEIA